MKHYSTKDNTVYADVTTKSGNSLVVLKSDVKGLREIYSRITESLNTWTQFFQIHYLDGVCIEYKENMFFLKNIEVDYSETFCTISVFGSDLQFRIPFLQTLKLKPKLEEVSYVDTLSNMTSYFNSKIELKVSGVPLKTFSEHGIHFVSCGSAEVMANLYTISKNLFEIEDLYTKQHKVLSPTDSALNTAAIALPQNCNLRIDSENKMVIELDNEFFLVCKLHLVDADLLLEYATYANPSLTNTKIWRIGL